MRFTLENDHWYAMELIDSHFGEDFRRYSPIRIYGITASGGGSRQFQMNFFHANYPAGVQDKNYLVETIDRKQNYLLGKVLDSDRIILLFGLDHKWLNNHFNADIRPGDSLEDWCERNSQVTY
jgi:hypothetical protein